MDMQRVCFGMHSMKVTDVCSRNAAMRVDSVSVSVSVMEKRTTS